MLSQKNLQRRLQSSTRINLARDLHDSLAQDLVAIGYKLDLLIADLPFNYRAKVREIRDLVTTATGQVRKELFALRATAEDPLDQINSSAMPLALDIQGDLSTLDSRRLRIVNELVRNAASHSKGRIIRLEITKDSLIVSDDGVGLFGVSELADQLGARLEISSSKEGTKVEIHFS
jgi:signal transduction histidine kinase